MTCRICDAEMELIITHGTVIMQQSVIYWCPDCGTLNHLRLSTGDKTDEWRIPNEQDINLSKQRNND